MKFSMPLFTLALVLSSAAGLLPAQEQMHYTFRYLKSSGAAQPFRTMTFSPDSTHLAISIAGKVDFVDTRQGRVTDSYRVSPFTIGYSSNGERVYLIAERKVALLDTKTGAEFRTSYKPTPGYLGLTLEKQYGKLLIKAVAPGGPAAAASIGLGDELIGIAEGRNGRIRNVTGRAVRDATDLFKGPAGSYLELRILPRGQFGEESTKSHVIRRQPGELVNNEIRFKEISVPKSGQPVAWCMSAGRHEFRSTWDGSAVAQLQTIDIENLGQYAISPDQTKFAAVAAQKSARSKYAVEVFEIATQDRLAYMPLPKSTYLDIAFAADNNRVLVATVDSVEIADVAKERFTSRLDLGRKPPAQEKERKESLGGEAGAATANAAGRAYETGASDKLVAKLAASAKDVVATADNEGNVKLWDLNTGSLLREMPKSLRGEPKAVAFSPNGERLAYHIGGVLHVVGVADVKSSVDNPSGAVAEPQD